MKPLFNDIFRASRQPTGRRPHAARLAAALMIPALMIPALLFAAVALSPATTLAETAETVETDGSAALEAYAEGKTPVAEPAAEAASAAPPPAPVPPASAGPQVHAADTAMPAVSNLTPADGSFTGPMPVISYEYSDPSGIIWPDGVHLFIDNRCSRTMPGPTTITASKLTYAAAAPLPEGPHVLESFLCDWAFNCGSIFWNITVDATAPVIGPGQPTGTINTSTTTVAASFTDGSGSGVAGGGIQVLVNGSDVTAACAVGAAGFSCGLSGLADGGHSVAVSVTDAVGNTGSSAWSFAVDTATIGITGQQPSPGSWQTSATPLMGVDFQPAPAGAIVQSSVTVLLDGVDVSGAAAITASGFLYMPASPLSEGEHTIQVSVSDDAGHAGESQWSFFTDSLAPEISDPAPTGDAGSRQPHVSAVFSDSGSGVDPASGRLTIDGHDETVSAAADQYGIVFTAHDDLEPGEHTVEVYVADRAGNSSTSTWSFSVPAPPAAPQLLQPFTTVTSIVMRPAVWILSPLSALSGSAGSAPGWTLTGFQSWPNTYYLPWLDPRPTDDMPGGELLIGNRGAGEAWVTVLIGSEEKWSGKLTEGGEEILKLDGAGGGPVRVVCPTGQSLDVRHRLGGSGEGIEALLEEDLDTTWYLPVFGVQGSDGTHQSRIVIANAGEQSAEVDVYVGDPALPDSLKGHFTIPAGSAALASLPEADNSNGAVRVSSSNDQPLLVSQRTLYRGALSETLGANRNMLARNLRLDELPAAGDGGETWLLVANPTDRDIEVEISTGAGRLRDGANDFFTIPAAGLVSIPVSGASGPLDIVARDCPFGNGVIASIQSSGPESFSEQVLAPAK